MRQSASKKRFTVHGPMIDGRFRVRDERTCAQTDFDELTHAIKYAQIKNDQFKR